MPSTRHADRRFVRAVATVADAAEIKIGCGTRCLCPGPHVIKMSSPIRINNCQLLISSDTSIGNESGIERTMNNRGNEHGRNRYDLAWTNSAIWSGSPFWELDHDTIYIGQAPGRNLERL
jgi:hypothetical protein